MKEQKKIWGFTLIELMLVVAIIGLLAAIALPKFSNMVVRAKEASILGKLGSLRSALTLYYMDNDGVFSTSSVLIPSLTVGGKYLDEIPSITIPNQTPWHTGNMVAEHNPQVLDSAASMGEAWTFIESQLLFVACTHTDSRGRTWSLY